jgi:hypothetical protein
MKTLNCDICIAGGGTGGVAAALAALSSGMTVVMTEECDRLGGQLTSQAVPVDENPWIDATDTGCTARYRRFRENVRSYYRAYYPLTEKARADARLNPGQGNVSPLCAEPRVAERVLADSLSPYLVSGALRVLFRTVPASADVVDDRIRSARFDNEETGDSVEIVAAYYLDATELGDLLPAVGAEFVTGAESLRDTSEPHALPGRADPLDQQAFTWCFAFDYDPARSSVIDKPRSYDFWKGYRAPFWPDMMLSWTYPDPISLSPTRLPLFAGPSDAPLGNDLWHYRRALYRKNFADGFLPSDVVLANWPQNDYWLGPLVGVSPETKERNLKAARELSLSFLYWMQTEAPRHDGGTGYPGLALNGPSVGTSDGFAAMPYIRESRRIRADFTILEQQIGYEARKGLVGAESFPDSVGIGSYRIDLHPSTSGRTYIDITNWPFQIPLGALIPLRLENLIAAGKDIGTTHITNGCYRLHPVEWNVGEAAGLLAAHCITKRLSPRAVRSRSANLADFQALVDREGIPRSWPEDIRTVPRVQRDPLGM